MYVNLDNQSWDVGFPTQLSFLLFTAACLQWRVGFGLHYLVWRKAALCCIYTLVYRWLNLFVRMEWNGKRFVYNLSLEALVEVKWLFYSIKFRVLSHFLYNMIFANVNVGKGGGESISLHRYFLCLHSVFIWLEMDYNGLWFPVEPREARRAFDV